MKRLLIIGASGHGRVAADIAKKNGYDEICFLDDNTELTQCGGYPVIGGSSRAAELDGDVIVAIGNAGIREKLQSRIEKAGKYVPVLIHPHAVVAEDVRIGKGTVVAAGAVINPGAVIGKGCIINTCASVDHDCEVEDFAHVSVGAHIAGTVKIGKNSWIGVGAAVSNNVTICGDCMIGAGAVVVRDIKESGTYVGVPARMIR